MTEKEKVKVGTANDQDAGAAAGGAHKTRKSNRKQIIVSKSVNQIGVLNSNNGDHNKDVEDYPIIENAIVEVLPRTWPGSNKEGGVAQVVKCYFTSDIEGESNGQSQEISQNQRLSHVDVKYTARRGREKMVPIEYCQAAPQYDDSYRRQKASKELALNGTNSSQGIGRTLRDRSAMKGRCSNCGSLRSDCNSCDWREETRLISFTSKKSQRKRIESDSDSEGSSEADSEEEDFGYDSSEYKALSLRERRQRNILSSSEESDVGDSDNEVLANLKQNSPKHTTQSFLQKRRKYRKPRYSQSNPKFEERMRFLDDLLQKKSEVPSQKTRNINYQRSVLEDLASLKSQSENEVNFRNSKRRNLDKEESADLVKSDKRIKRINAASSSFSEQMDVEVEEDNELVDDNGMSTPCKSPMSESRVVAKFVDGADIGENEVEEDELTNLNKTPTKIYTVSHEVCDRRDEIKGYYEESPSRNTFIQPEGKEAADNLPSDVIDKTKGFTFCDLPNCFEEIAEKMLSIWIPQYDKRIKDYENKIKSITSERGDTFIDLAVRTERDW